MEPRFVDRPAFRLMGVVNRGNPGNLNYDDIWGRQFEAHHEFLKTVCTEGAYYGAYFCTGEEGIADMMAGMAVPCGLEAPEGLQVRELAAATYAVFDCTVSQISQTWNDAYGKWLPASGYVNDDAGTSFECFPADMEPDGALEIYIPVRPK